MGEQVPTEDSRLEVPGLVAVLVAGAVLRYWLSTVLPFDAGELGILQDASVPDRSGRVPFIMFNGVFLFLGYLLVRRSAGVAAAFCALLALQGSATFQEQALRIRPLTVPLFVVTLVLTYLRFRRPPWRAGPAAGRVLTVVSAVLALRFLNVMAGLPARLDDVRVESRADPQVPLDSVRACGGDVLTALEAFRACPIRWPLTRAVGQQEALLRHRALLGPSAVPITEDRPAPAGSGLTVIYDPAAVAFFAVPDGPRVETARNLIRSDSPEFFALPR